MVLLSEMAPMTVFVLLCICTFISTVVCTIGDEAKERILEFFNMGYHYGEIVSSLMAVYGISVSLRTVKRFLKSMHLRRRGEESRLEEIIGAILEEHEGGIIVIFIDLVLCKNLDVERSMLWQTCAAIHCQTFSRPLSGPKKPKKT